MEKYLKYIPKTLQQDFIENRVVPFVGSGFSKNANIPQGMDILDWDGLGKAIAKYIPDYNYTSAIDALSLFESQFSRARLIETIAKELNINSISPGDTHRAFCALGFEEICTTNFDCLIEKTLSEVSAPFSTIISEERLPINLKETTKVIKIHGDFNNPSRMVITEDDYDTFLDKNRILATYISNLFITKTIFLIGYSLDDCDIRSLWKIIGSRLGKLSNPAYVVLVGADQNEVLKFERRNIKVINLPGNKSQYKEILKELFEEIKMLIDDELPGDVVFTTEKANEEFKMPSDNTNLCFISTQYNRLSRLKELLYPVLSRNGIIPITLNEVIMPGDNITRKMELIINQATISIVDITNNSPFVAWEYEQLLIKKKKYIIIKGNDDNNNIPYRFQNESCLKYSFTEDNEYFIEQFEKRLISINSDKEYRTEQEEPFRLLEKREYNAAVISAYRSLEITLANKFKIHSPLSLFLKTIYPIEENDNRYLSLVRENLRIRNKIVHTEFVIDGRKAKEIVRSIDYLCRLVNDGKILLDGSITQ